MGLRPFTLRWVEPRILKIIKKRSKERIGESRWETIRHMSQTGWGEQIDFPTKPALKDKDENL